MIAAVENGYHTCIEQLLNAGAGVKEMYPDGFTALNKAAYICDFYSVNLLIQAGADVNIRSSYDSFTLLMSAVITGDENCLKIAEELETPFVEENHSHTKCVEML